jgi:hypothetical protein
MFRSFSKPNPERLLAKRDAAGLLRAINYRHDPEVRAKAAAALGALGGPDAIDGLINALADDAPGVRGSAALGLKANADPRAQQALAGYKRQYCMRCGTRIQSVAPDQIWTGQPGLMPWEAVQRIGTFLTTHRASCQCGAVLCRGCSPSGGGNLPACEFCGSTLS